MPFWIYNLGLGVPVSQADLTSKLKPQPLTPLVKPHAIGDTQEKEQTRLIDEKTTSSPEKRSSKETAKNEILSDYADTQQDRKVQRVFYAEQIMSSPVSCLSTESTFEKAKENFVHRRFRHFPVLDRQQQLQGIISDRDLLSLAATQTVKNLNSIPLSEFMQTKVLTATKKTTIRELSEVMLKQHISALPIIDESGKLQGIVSRSDILNCLVQHGHMELWA